MTTTNPERILDYLLIGGGLAAATAAEEIRKRDAQGSILIVTNDSHLPYHRPPLSKEYLRGEIGEDGTYGRGGVYVQLPGWYEEQRVEVLRAVEATELDTMKRIIRLGDGRILEFRTLLLATGGRPRPLNVPGANLPGVHVLRTLADSTSIRAQLAEGRRVVVVGSGFIGLETAASALTKGAQVTIVDRGPRIWDKLMSPTLSEFFQRQFTKQGAVTRHEYVATEFIAGPDGHLARVCIAPTSGSGRSEELPCDLTIVGVGIELNTDLATAAGLEVDPRHGIVVDECLQTYVAGIFAAGDASAYPDPIVGRTHFEHWDNAIASGQAAATNMTGGHAPYRYVPYFFSDLFDLSLNMLGYPSSEANIVVRGDMCKNSFTALYARNGVLRAALMVNDDAKMDLLHKLIAASVPVPKDPEQMADPSFDLASLLPRVPNSPRLSRSSPQGDPTSVSRTQ